MNQVVSDFADSAFEQIEHTTKTIKKTIKTIPQGIASQIKGQTQDTSSGMQDKKMDTITGKPIPSKKMLGQLNQQVAQLQMVRLKKLREELEKQRLKINNEQSAIGNKGQTNGPEVKHEDKKPKDDAITRTLSRSKSTGETAKDAGG